MELNVKDQFTTTEGLMCLVVDNVCDEINYDQKTSMIMDKDLKIKLKRCTTMGEYLDTYNAKTLQNNEEFLDALDQLEHSTNLLRNNYIFMKGFEEEYSNTFLKETNVLLFSSKFVLCLENVFVSLFPFFNIAVLFMNLTS